MLLTGVAGKDDRLVKKEAMREKKGTGGCKTVSIRLD